jgi:hypothetical protein
MAGVWSLRARIPGDRSSGGFWRRFKPDRWYPAELQGEEVRLLDGRHSTAFRRADVEIRAVPDDEWEIRSATRTALEREGQSIDYPTRMAECPEGHARPVPTRFDRPVVELRCRECDRVYRLVTRS